MADDSGGAADPGRFAALVPLLPQLGAAHVALLHLFNSILDANVSETPPPTPFLLLSSRSVPSMFPPGSYSSPTKRTIILCPLLHCEDSGSASAMKDTTHDDTFA